MSRKQILVAEDEPSIVVSLKFLLTAAGYDVAVAHDGAEALRIAEATLPDLVLLDLMLPSLNGHEICRRMRRTRGLEHTPILMLTARGRQEETATSLALGANACMTKPFSTKELVQVVSEMLTLSGPAQ